MDRDTKDSRQVSSDFFGRRKELAEIVAALDASQTGHANIVLLSGEPGIGKTRLAEEAAELAARMNFCVLCGGWRDSVRLPEFSVWGQIARGLLRHHRPSRLGSEMQSALSELSGLLPELRNEYPGLAEPLRDNGDQKRLRLFDAILQLVRHASSIQPLLLVFDNLHLAPAQSLDLLAGLLADSADCRLMFTATFRDLPVYRRDPLLSFLSEFRPARTVRELRLDSLSPEETAAFAAHILDGRASPEVLQEIQERTEGHPLFTREAARLIRHDLDLRGAGSNHVWEKKVPAALNVTIQLRVRQMSPAGVAILRLAAVIGKSVTVGELRLAGADMDDAAIDRSLDEAVGHGFLVAGESPGEYSFVHSLIRIAIREQTPGPERRRLCAKLAEAVESAFPENLSEWAPLLAGWWNEVEGEKARAAFRRHTRLAAETALERGWWDEAIALYERVTTPGNEALNEKETAADCVRLASAHYRAGHRQTGVGLFRKAFAYYKEIGDAESMIRIATQQVYLLVGQPGFHDFLEEVLPYLPPGSRLEADVLHFEGVAQFLNVGDYKKASVVLQRAYDVGITTGDSVIQARNLAGLGYIDFVFGRHEPAVEKAARALALLRGKEDPYAEGHAGYVMSCALIALGRGADAIPYEDRFMEISQAQRDGVQIATASQLRVRQDIMRGSWAEARRVMHSGLEACPDHQFLLACCAFVEYTCGAFDAGDSFRDRIQKVRRDTPSGPWCIHIQAASTAAVRARNTGDPADLGRYVPLLRSIAVHPEAHPFVVVRAHLVMAFIAALTGDDLLSREQYAAIAALPRLQLVRPYFRDRILGLAAHSFGDHDRTIEHFEQALRLARRVGDRPMEAWILCESGEALIPRRSDVELVESARRRLIDAQEMAKRLSMPPLESRATAALKSLSEFLGRGEPPHLHMSQREIQVLKLAGAGLTNHAIADELAISVHTVANHISRILQKTGTSNRTEAASRARRLGVLDESPFTPE